MYIKILATKQRPFGLRPVGEGMALVMQRSMAFGSCRSQCPFLGLTVCNGKSTERKGLDHTDEQGFKLHSDQKPHRLREATGHPQVRLAFLHPGPTNQERFIRKRLQKGFDTIWLVAYMSLFAGQALRKSCQVTQWIWKGNVYNHQKRIYAGLTEGSPTF